MFRTPASLYRVLAIAEAITWTLLIAALIARAVGAPAIVVTIAGGIHGFVFLSYGATAILVAFNQRWSIGLGLLAVASAIIPFATIPMEIWLHRKGRLVGEWRLDESEHPQDRTWYDKTMRWFLNHAVLLVVLIAVAVVALYVVLLLVGPPGGK
jgi:integral membrane protein